MTLYLLGKSEVNPSEIIAVQGQDIFSYHDLISKIFMQYCRKIQVAEPIQTKNDGNGAVLISWYAETLVEPVLPTEAQKKAIYSTLSDSFAILRKNLTVGSLEREVVDAVFHMQDIQDILITPDQIILKGWGVKSGTSPVMGQGKPSGLYLPAFLQSYHGARVSPAMQSEDSHSVSPLEQSSPLLDQGAKNSGNLQGKTGFFTWISPSRMLAAALFFAIGLLLGFRLIYAERPLQIAGLSPENARELVQKAPEIDRENQDFNREIASLKDRLDHPSCDITEKQDPSDQSNQSAVSVPSAPSVTPPSEAQDKAQDKAENNQSTPASSHQGDLVEMLEKSTVFILALKEQEETVVSGTGFFVTPDIVVTNRHVVEGANNNRVIITNKNLGKLTVANIISLSRSSAIGGLDLAILKVEHAPPQPFLNFTLNAQPLQDVVAAGYPGILTAQDNSMKQLLKGDIHAIPGVIMTKGQINGIQENQEGGKIMPHSAMVSPGNSGGPLADLCGRVVGINTFVTMDQDTASHGNYAQKSDSIIQALQAANIPIQVQSDVCQGQQGNAKPSTENPIISSKQSQDKSQGTLQEKSPEKLPEKTSENPSTGQEGKSL